MKDGLKFENHSLQRLRQFLIVFSLILGLLYTVACRHSMTADGTSYLDMGRGFANGNYDALINPIWSPAYSFIIGCCILIFKPNPYFEFTLIHLINYLLFALSLFSFDFFLQSSISSFHKKETNHSLPEWAILLIGYILFLQTTINHITLWKVTPDMLLSIFIYLSFGFTAIYISNKQSLVNSALLGITIGFGYLSKAGMLPIGIILFLFCFYHSVKEKKYFSYLLVSVFTFTLIISPYVLSLSNKQGHFTFGESGKLNYAWYVNSVPFFTHWQGNDKNGMPLHRTKQIFTKPATYEFKSPIKATYSPWFNPMYWYEGVKIKFDIGLILNAFTSNLSSLFNLILKQQIAIVFGLVILFFISYKKREDLYKDILKVHTLTIIPLLCTIPFLLIHFEDRYTSALISIFFIGLLISIKSNKIESKSINCCIAIAIVLFINVGTRSIREIFNWIKNDSSHIEWQISNQLSSHGIKSGDYIATIGYEVPFIPFWASIAKVQIISEIMKKDENDFWHSDKKIRAEVIETIKNTQARAIIAKNPPRNCTNEGWIALPPSKSYVLLLRSEN